MFRKRILILLLVVTSWNSTVSASSFNELAYLKAIKSLNYQKAIDLSRGLDNPEIKKQGLELAQVLFYAGQKTLKIDTILPKKSELLTKALFNLKMGYNALYSNPYNSTPFITLNEAYRIALDLKNKELQKIALLAILDVFLFELEMVQNQHSEYLKKLEQLVSDDTDKFRFTLCKINFDQNSKRIENIDHSLYDILNEALTSFDDKHPFTALYYRSKAYSHESKLEHTMAINLYEKAVSMSKGKPFLKYVAFRSYIRISEIMRNQKLFEKALKYVDSSRYYASLSDTLRAAYHINIYKSLNNYGLENLDEAYSQLLEASITAVNLEANKNSKTIAIKNVQLGTAEKEKQILVEQEQKTQNRNIAIGLGGGLAAVSLIGFLLFKNSKRKQRIAEQQRLIEIQKTEKILRDQELTTIDAMLEGQEKERQRLASDLHDSVGATLSAAKLQFDYLSKNKNKLGELDTLFSKTEKLLEDAYTEVRSMAHIKNSGVLAKNGLLPAIQKLAKNASGTNKLHIDVQDFGLDDRLENSLEITVFRIIQELVTNIIKHANATEACIAITQHEDSLNIMVEDNGKGFNPRKSLKLEEGMGLDSIERRVEHLEGSMEVDSSEGTGTTIVIDIPL